MFHNFSKPYRSSLGAESSVSTTLILLILSIISMALLPVSMDSSISNIFATSSSDDEEKSESSDSEDRNSDRSSDDGEIDDANNGKESNEDESSSNNNENDNNNDGYEGSNNNNNNNDDEQFEQGGEPKENGQVGQQQLAQQENSNESENQNQFVLCEPGTFVDEGPDCEPCPTEGNIPIECTPIDDGTSLHTPQKLAPLTTIPSQSTDGGTSHQGDMPQQQPQDTTQDPPQDLHSPAQPSSGSQNLIPDVQQATSPKHDPVGQQGSGNGSDGDDSDTDGGTGTPDDNDDGNDNDKHSGPGTPTENDNDNITQPPLESTTKDTRSVNTDTKAVTSPSPSGILFSPPSGVLDYY